MPGFKDMAQIALGVDPTAYDRAKARETERLVQVQTANERLQQELLDTQKKRDSALARSRYRQVASAQGLSDPDADAFATYSQGNDSGNANIGAEALGNVMRAIAQSHAAQATDPNDMNRQLILASGKPQHLTTINDGMAFNPFATPDKAQLAPTDIGRSMVAEHEAAAKFKRASADASEARADLSRRTDPNRPRSSSTGGRKPAAPKPPKPGEVIDGYKFKGGNPADKKNWEKV